MNQETGTTYRIKRLAKCIILHAYFTYMAKEAPGMISLFKYLLRFTISLCITIAAIFMAVCVALVLYIALKGGIKIRKISSNKEGEAE